MRTTQILPLIFFATLVAGCGDEKSSSGESSKDSGKPPENMCEAVAPAVPKDWGLTKKSAAKSKEKTDCTLADASGKTTLVVSVVKPKSGTVDAALKDLCNTYIGAPLKGDEDECTKVGPVELKGSPAELQRGVLLQEPEGVLWVSYRTNKPDVAAQAEDVLDDVEDAVSEE